ncbi:hypothetical protein [Eudoraea sp.]|uniref:hypothetical protein n=1 Tax=Eudoraea sp. TaxID=1979955 RepID=UPI003C758D05
MRSSFLGVVFVLGFSFGLSAQLNDYKYVIVPKSFDGFKKENQYNTSTLIKYLFTQKGFETHYEDELPLELYANRCAALTVDLLHNSSMFNTVATLVLKDCSSKEIYTSAEGISKDKDQVKSYKEAIQEAFISIKALPYSYKPSLEENNSAGAVPAAAAVTADKPSSIMEQKAPAPPAEPAYDPIAASSISNPEKVVEVAAVTESTAAVVSTSNEAKEEVWYAQEIPNGFQLVDNTPKVRLKIYKTDTPDMFIAESDEVNGVVYKRDTKWFFEYIKSGESEVQELNIKF